MVALGTKRAAIANTETTANTKDDMRAAELDVQLAVVGVAQARSSRIRSSLARMDPRRRLARRM